MKKYIPLLVLAITFGKLNAQTVVIPNSTDTRVITTGTAFLLIASDARAAGLGDQGVATSPDAYSQQWNLSKYAFSKEEQGISISYTPYLTELVNDIFLGNVGYYKKLNERSAVSASFRYFSLGEIQFTDESGTDTTLEKPNEFTLDLGYSLKLSDNISMGVALRYLRSDLQLGKTQGLSGATGAGPASTFAVDIGAYYQSEEKAFESFNGKYRLGAAIQNLGPKIKYDDAGQDNFLPTTLRLGGGFDFILDEANTIGVTLETTKLLVPTPPVYGQEYNYTDANGNGSYDDGETLGAITNPNVIIEGNDPDVSFASAVFSSFGDAPGGISEEIDEFTYSVGAEYKYQENFAFRLGYFNEAETKGARKFFTLGAGFKYNVIDIDISYLISASKVPSPLENTLRFSLAFNF